MLEIYTDGACSRNGTPQAKASWGFVVVEDGVDTDTQSGRVKAEYTKAGWIGAKQSNNTGELIAILKALLYVIERGEDKVTILTDSKYCIDSLSNWNIEKKVKGKQKANYNLIKSILALDIEVTYEWVRGHDGNYFNEIADQLANNLVGL